MHYLVFLLLLAPSLVESQSVRLDCETKRTFDGEEYGIKGNPNADVSQAFQVDIDMRYARAQMQERDYLDVVLGPTFIVMEHSTGPGSDGKTRTNTTEINRETLAVKTLLGLDQRPFKEWKGSCSILSKEG